MIVRQQGSLSGSRPCQLLLNKFARVIECYCYYIWYMSLFLYLLPKDGALRPAELADVFSTAPDSPWSDAPYKDAAEMNVLGGLSLEGFLSEWALMMLLDPASCLANLIYVGYPGDPASAFQITRRRKVDRKKLQTQRNVIQCYVFGPKNAGKSALLNSLIGRPFSGKYTATTSERFAANMVDLPGHLGGNDVGATSTLIALNAQMHHPRYQLIALRESSANLAATIARKVAITKRVISISAGIKKTLVMREMPEDSVKDLLSNKESLAPCDIAVFVHDSSDESSWRKAKELLLLVASHGENNGYEVPCLIVSTKDDLDPYPLVIQDSTRVSQDMGIETPIPVSMKLGDFNNVFVKIVTAAQQPHKSIPETEAGKSRKQYRQLVNRSLMFVSVGAAVTLVGLAAYRVYASRKNTSS